MNETRNNYDLEDRTFAFALSLLNFVTKLPKTIETNEYRKQIIRSSGSVGANYIEANESITKKEFKYRIRICLKEIKETIYWLRLINSAIQDLDQGSIGDILDEAIQLKKIFASISQRCSKP